MTTAELIVLSPQDNVAVCSAPLAAGSRHVVGDTTVVAAAAIPAGHKLAIRAIPAGQPVLKYGQPIGLASAEIAAGDHVHSHNLVDEHAVVTQIDTTSPPPAPERTQHTFQGYVRDSGRVGTRNYVAVISTVNCSASVSKMVAARFDPGRMQRWPHVDGVIAITHDGGCAMAYDGLKHQMLSRTLAGIIDHANVAGCLLIGLGCEQNTIGYMAQQHRFVPLLSPDGQELTQRSGVPVLSMQDEGGTRRTIEKAEQLVEHLLQRADTCRRQTVDASHLIVGLECGGSDGYSGITANPAVGAAADRVVACGGTAILSETSEIYGAEHLLARRSRSPAVAHKLIERIEWWKGYAAMFGQRLDNNPSVGNKAGGLTTITEKSLGAVSKSGSTALEQVYLYAERVQTPGLVIMDTPGYDPASVTGMVAGGANMILFTTGRGSCFGCKPTPSLKVATNTPLFRRMEEDMDIDAGPILAGTPVDEVGAAIFDTVLRVASGERTKSELLGIGDNEFVPWTVGPVL